VSLYVMPIEDPIIDAWQSAFPELFSEFDEIPTELRDHLRYPQDLFRVQTNMYARYQVEDPEPLIIGTEQWAVAQDPGRTVKAGGTEENSVDEFGVITTREQRVNPYYTLLTLPGEDEPSFVTMRTFVPFDEADERRELEAFMVGEVDADGQSRLVSYEMNSAEAPGPVLVATSIAQNEEIAARLTLLNQSGSSVEFGDLLLLPIDNAILWVRSLYVAAEGTSVPTLQNVIVSVGEGEQLAIGDSLSDALASLFPGEDFGDILADPAGGTRTPVQDDPVEPPPDADPSTADELFAAIDSAFQASNDALAEDPPDRTASAEALDEIDDLLEQWRRLTAPDREPEPEPDLPEPVDPGEVDT
jgi:uncharacterized membrane protein (UPF0182 family)